MFAFLTQQTSSSNAQPISNGHVDIANGKPSDAYIVPETHAASNGLDKPPLSDVIAKKTKPGIGKKQI